MMTQISVLTQIYVKKYFCQGHCSNGCCAKLASNLNAKVGLFILYDPRQHETFIFSIYNFKTMNRYYVNKIECQ